MATGPKWNKQRGFWYAQFWDGEKTTRRKIADGPPNWKEGDPAPRRPPSEALSGFLHWEEVEKRAREREGKGHPTALDKFLADHVATYHKPGTRRIVRVAVDQFLAWCKGQGITRFDQVTKVRCDEWMRHVATSPGDPAKLKGKSPSKATIETKRAYLAAAWGRLIDLDVIDKNPWSGVKNYGEEREKPKRAWTPSQFDRLLAASDDWLRDILTFGVYTGLRIGSMMKIEWTDWIHAGPDEPHFGYLNIRKEITKTEAYKVPVSAKLHDLLGDRLGKYHPRFIMTSKTGKPIASRTQTAEAIIAACKAADLPHPQSPNHHLRRTFGRWAVFGHLTGQPVPLYVVKTWMGHSSVDQTVEYLDLEDEDSFKFMVPSKPSADPADSRTPRPASDGSA